MTYKKIFVDSDILLDLILQRSPFNAFAKILLNQGQILKLNFCTSTLVLANMHYMIAKNFGKHLAKEHLKNLSNIIHLLPFESNDAIAALDSEHIDFEDTIQFIIAQKHNCDLIISRNLKHYKKFSLPVLTAEQFLETL